VCTLENTLQQQHLYVNFKKLLLLSKLASTLHNGHSQVNQASTTKLAAARSQEEVPIMVAINVKLQSRSGKTLADLQVDSEVGWLVG